MNKVLLYLLIVLCCVVGTGLFLVYHHAVYAPFTWTDYVQVLLHSLPQHLTVAGYVMAVPLLVALVYIWLPERRGHFRRKLPDWYGRFMARYMAVMAVLLLIGWLVNVVLYGFWGFVLDGTVLLYLVCNPFEALAECPWWAVILAIALSALTAWGVYQGVYKLYSKRPMIDWTRLPRTLGVLLLCGLDFLAIRGGWSTATMNPGRAYFSSEVVLNHAAVDPVFNFVYSLGKSQRFDLQYRFMADDEASEALSELESTTLAWSRKAYGIDDLALDSLMLPCADSLRQEMRARCLQELTDSLRAENGVLRSRRPNILLVLLESFSGAACQYLTAEADSGWMPSVNQAMAEGVAFTRFYANSFRTDRGVAATLASYPGQPTNSVMKDQSKCDNLQYLSKVLQEEDYRLQFIHGGDVNFTNMQGFLRAGGFTDIVGDTDFPLTERLDKWGVRDDMMFDYVARTVASDVKTQGAESHPFFKVFLSLSSHEPFEVPSARYKDVYLNSVAYADSCLGAMLDLLKAQPEVWDNLLVIGLPDHCYARFPASIQLHEPLRYHIPMFWTGGAVRGHRDVAVVGQQTDLAATLLGQLGIAPEGLGFSKDMLDPVAPHYAFYAFSDGFGLITDSCQYVQDNQNSGVGLQPGTQDPDGRAERWGKAYLQRLYDDLLQR